MTAEETLKVVVVALLSGIVLFAVYRALLEKAVDDDGWYQGPAWRLLARWMLFVTTVMMVH